MAKATTRNRETSAEWAATVQEPITASRALERLRYAYDYSTDAINAVMSKFHGTIPPPAEFLPDLYKVRENVASGITTINALAERTPEANVAHQYVELGRKLGAQLIDESNAAMDRSTTSESPAEVAKDIVKVAEHSAALVAKAGIRIFGFSLTMTEALIGVAIVDEVFNGGKLRRSIIGGAGGRRRSRA